MISQVNPFFLAVTPVAFNLISIYKPILIFLTIMPYAWVISTVIEMDSRKRRLFPERWGSLSLAVFVIGIATVLFVPIFWIGWPLMVGMFVGVPYAYWKFRDNRVAPADKFDIFATKLAAFKAKRKMKQAFDEVTASYGTGKGKFITPPEKGAPDFETHLNTERMLVPSLPARASRIELAPVAGGYLTVQTVDTIKSRRETYPADVAVKMIDLLKTAAGLDIKERRKRQSAILGMKIGDGEVKFLLSTWGSSAGQILRIELDREKQLTIPFDQLGMLPIQAQTLKDALENVLGGVVLVLVPPTHGLTTLGYALLTEHNAYTSDIKTIERQVDRRLEGVTQLAWIAGEATNEYSTALQSIVRRGPNVMLISDITDAGTGPILTHANSQNTLFYVLIPTDSVTIGLSTYLKAVGDPKSAANSLRAVVAGRLVRKLCPECRQSFQASPDQSKRLGAAAGKPLQLFRASGKVQIKNDIVDCGNCQGTGFLGTVGVFEVVRPDDRGREMLIAGDIANAYQQMRRAYRTPLTQECALLKVRAGETSLEEIARVFAPKVPPAAKPSGAAATPAANAANAPTTTPKTLKKEAK